MADKENVSNLMAARNWSNAAYACLDRIDDGIFRLLLGYRDWLGTMQNATQCIVYLENLKESLSRFSPPAQSTGEETIP